MFLTPKIELSHGTALLFFRHIHQAENICCYIIIEWLISTQITLLWRRNNEPNEDVHILISGN